MEENAQGRNGEFVIELDLTTFYSMSTRQCPTKNPGSFMSTSVEPASQECYWSAKKSCTFVHTAVNLLHAPCSSQWDSSCPLSPSAPRGSQNGDVFRLLGQRRIKVYKPMNREFFKNGPGRKIKSWHFFFKEQVTIALKNTEKKQSNQVWRTW